MNSYTYTLSYSDRLFLFVSILGTPNEVVWPGVTILQDWNEAFPTWPALDIASFCGPLSEEGVDLVEVGSLLRFVFRS